jgi:hypothetical protein
MALVSFRTINYNPNHDPATGRFSSGGSRGKIGNTPQKISVLSQEEAILKLNSALEKNNISLKDGQNLSEYHKAVYAKVVKEIPGGWKESKYYPNDPDGFMESEEYLNINRKRQQRYEELLGKINNSIGVNTEKNATYITEKDYNNLIDTNKQFSKFNISFFKTGAFSLEDGRVKLEILEDLNGSKPKYWYGADEEKSFYDKLINNNKFVKVDNKKMRTLLESRAKNNKNIQSLTYPAINRTEVRALQEYNLVPAINQILRNGKSTKGSDYVESAINKTYSKPQTVYRGIRGSFSEKVSKMNVGDTITDKGFMSTSVSIGNSSKEGARKFGQDGVIMQIKTKGGFGNSIDMNPYVSDVRFISEDEVLLNRNTKIELVKTSTKNITEPDGSTIKLPVMEFEEK